MFEEMSKVKHISEHSTVAGKNSLQTGYLHFMRLNRTTVETAQINTDLNGLLVVIRNGDNHKNSDKFSAERLTRMWPDWLSGLSKYQTWIKDTNSSREHNFGEPRLMGRIRLRILLYIGAFSRRTSPGWEEGLSSGAPLGELVQWTDLMAGLYILGHKISVHKELETATRFLHSSRCSVETSSTDCDIDLIYTDIIGYEQIVNRTNVPKCKFRILDSFGTQSRYNRETGPYSGLKLNLQQFYTYLPHSPDNTFLGFVIEQSNATRTVTPKNTSKPIALVYGKQPYMLAGTTDYLKVLSEFFELHANFPGSSAQGISEFVHTHKSSFGETYFSLMKSAQVFVGLGFPYEGPAPLEAIANGLIFLNVRFTPPHNKYRVAFFKDKPTARELTSQHPYIEHFIGEPYSYLVDKNNAEQIRGTVRRLLAYPVSSGYRTFEFSPVGFIERLNALLERQHFCDPSKPINSAVDVSELQSSLRDIFLKVVISESGQSCASACALHKRIMPLLIPQESPTSYPSRASTTDVWTGYLYNRFSEALPTLTQHDWLSLRCGPEYFYLINTESAFLNAVNQTSCLSVKQMNFAAPYWNPREGTCVLQNDILSYDCVTPSLADIRRLCPCTDTLPGQPLLSAGQL
ncbi:unnamed protein product [Calicophoron daubneyi]|uniref:alpha-1,6-mannosyl-glycoprotein 6-beta-N-acetylglucosaminyltransferase n=1 Tax=Calicophoron daubneyi TaxID=300641 RepID=A0AAV2TVE0_CALDB